MGKVNKKKIVLVALALLLFLLVLASVIIINSLPSASRLSQALGANKKKVEPVSKSDEKVAAVEKKSTDQPGQNQQVNSEETPLSEVEAESEEDEESKRETILTFMNEDFDDVRVCENLGKTEYFERTKSGKDFSFQEMMKDEGREDSFLEALRTPLKAVFQDESVKPLLEEVLSLEAQELTEEEKESFFTKVGFYSRVASAGVSLISKRSYFESISDQAMHLAVLAKMAKLKPEILEENDVRDLCQEMQEVMIGEEKIDVASERTKIKAIIEKYGFKNEELDFDPDRYIKFKVDFSEKGMSFSLNDKNPAPN